jgi:hypothetical protein
MSPPATLVMWFQLRSPELAEDFERLMTEDRDIVGGSLDTVSDWRLTRPADVPGQSIGQADYVLIAEIVEVERFEQQASEQIQRMEDDLAHLVSTRGLLVLRPVLCNPRRWRPIRPALGLSTCELAIGGDRCRFEANGAAPRSTLCDGSPRARSRCVPAAPPRPQSIS